MRFLPLLLYGKQQTGSDQLNNPIYELVQIGESTGRFSSWTAKEVALDNRDITVNNRKIITQAKKETLIQVDKVKIDELYHSVTEIIGNDYSRWRIVVVNRYGSAKM
ncbi:hypothetical protein ACTQ5K_02760 [Niallia sp. Sow4_A1]|uniref:hypothetical protein n=1 Tax=Niallia sp. Sow4_A1 TaxID=3438793 RepID=UPI003F9D9E41